MSIDPKLLQPDTIPSGFMRPGKEYNCWLLDCSRCTKVEEFKEIYLFKVMRDVADSDWELIDGEAVCPLCVEELRKK